MVKQNIYENMGDHAHKENSCPALVNFAENEAAIISGKKYLDELLIDLKIELENLNKQKTELESQSKILQLTKENTEYIKMQNQELLNYIYHITPEEQYILLKEFIEYITINKSDGTYKLTYKLEALNPNDGEREILVKKTLYFSLDSK
jgi:hypothetical protein